MLDLFKWTKKFKSTNYEYGTKNLRSLILSVYIYWRIDVATSMLPVVGK